MKQWARRAMGVGATMGLAPVVFAQVDPCGVGQTSLCVSYSTTPQAVPLSPQLMVLLVVFLGAVALFRLRHKVGGPLGLALALTLGGWLWSQPNGSWANGYPRKNLSESNPVVFATPAGARVVVNNLTVNATITAVTYNGAPVGATGSYGGYERCFVGKVLVPHPGSGTDGLCVVPLDS
jgi:hypothetical protein